MDHIERIRKQNIIEEERKRILAEKKNEAKLRIEKYNLMVNCEDNVELQLEKQKLFEMIFVDNSIVDLMFEKGYIPYFYNGCYGGRGHSKEYDVLSSLFPVKDTSFYEGYSISSTIIAKSINDAKLLIFLCEKANGTHSRPVFDFVKIEYYNYINIKEYDGFETIIFNKTKYHLAQTRLVVYDDSYTASEKINKIKLILEDKCEESIIDYDGEE